jgi:hypothetical protein
MTKREVESIAASTPVDLDADFDRLNHSVMDLIKERNELLATLREISEGRGRFSRDNFEHARNTIEDMKQLALDAIAKVERK